MSSSSNNDDSGTPAIETASKTTPASLQEGTPAEGGEAEFQQCLNALDDRQKSAYLEIQQKAPHLLTEAPPQRFLSVESGNAHAAARRYCAYWETRRKLLDNRYYLLPLSQTGEGALKRAEISVLHSGYVAFLSNNDNDNLNKVICYDGSRLPNTCSSEARLRCMLYMYQVISENPSSQLDGIVILCSVNPYLRSLQQVLQEDLAVSLLDVLPLKLFNLVLVCPAHMEPLFPALKGSLDPDLASKTTVHCVSPNLQAHLQAIFGNCELPEALGGTWKHTQHSQWCELRTRVEWFLPVGRSGQKVAIPASLDAISAAPLSLSKLSEEERLDRRRKMNVLHSRRKRERKKVQVRSLQESYNHLREQNLHLHQMNKYLEALLQSAQQAIEIYHQRQGLGQFTLPSNLPVQAESVPPQPGATAFLMPEASSLHYPLASLQLLSPTCMNQHSLPHHESILAQASSLPLQVASLPMQQPATASWPLNIQDSSTVPQTFLPIQQLRSMPPTSEDSQQNVSDAILLQSLQGQTPLDNTPLLCTNQLQNSQCLLAPVPQEAHTTNAQDKLTLQQPIEQNLLHTPFTLGDVQAFGGTVHPHQQQDQSQPAQHLQHLQQQ